jgi:SnoaL-like domain
MDKRLSDLLDKQSIYEVLVRYCRGADRCDEATLRSVYHEDASDDHGYWRGSGYEFAAFLPGRLGVANSATTHSISNVLIELQGDTARSEAQVLATLVREGTDPVLADVMGARYLDRLSRRDGEWRIDERTVVLDWHHVQTWATGDAPVSLDGFVKGARHPADPVYEFFA